MKNITLAIVILSVVVGILATKKVQTAEMLDHADPVYSTDSCDEEQCAPFAFDGISSDGLVGSVGPGASAAHPGASFFAEPQEDIYFGIGLIIGPITHGDVLLPLH